MSKFVILHKRKTPWIRLCCIMKVTKQHLSESNDSSHFPELRKWAIVVLWQELFLAKSVVFPWYPERKMLIRILIRWLIIRLEYDLHKSNFLNWLYMNAEWCIVFAGDTFFRECCKCWFGHFHYTTQSNSRCLSFMQNHELAHL